jgi:DNA modification methylase
MPTLHWIGKDKVVKHHHEVPFKTLRREYVHTAPEGTPTNSTGNRIIHGDNLEALKALLPEFEGRVKCIYIDPPYNTGNEGWVYNDNVNDPRIQKWLHQVVGKEGEDLSRHDKWLCMMYPRLKLLHRLLALNGSIWISIDDIEVANLRLVLDEIFGAGNFVANVLWQKKYAVANDHKTIAPMHDHILVYRKSEQWQRNLLPRTEEKDRQYRYEDEKGIFRPDNYTCSKSADERPNLYYPIANPNTGEEIWPKRTRVWSYSEDEYQRHVAEGLIYWGKDGTGKVPAFKRYKHLLKNDGVVPATWWEHGFAGHTDAAKKEIRGILSDNSKAIDFITPKPSTLIEKILTVATNPGDTVLDSYAGSGTTAHAVLKLNAQDGGKRRFILTEMMEYAESITAERVRRVMAGYGEDNKAIAGLGGSFEYYTIGEALFDGDGNLNEAVPVEEIRRYVAYTEGVEYGLSGMSPYYIGQANDAAYLFHYEPDRATALDYEFLNSLSFTENARPTTLVVYADNCLLSQDQLRKHGIIFKKIPRDITRF